MLLNPAWNTILKPRMPKVELRDLRSDVSDLTTYTFTDVSIGDIGTDMTPSNGSDVYGTHPHCRSGKRKVIYVIVHAEDDAITFAITSCSIGGVAGSEQTDRGGGTNAINTGIYAWGTNQLQGITDTDVVVVMNEAVTACAIGVVAVENIGLFDSVASQNQTATSATGSSPAVTLTNHETYEFTLFGSTSSAINETVIFTPPTGTGNVAPMLLYEQANAEMAYAAAWSYNPGWTGGNLTACGAICDWSGAAAFDLSGILHV